MNMLRAKILSAFEKGWVSALTDGEGCIGIAYRHLKGHGLSPSPFLEISNTNKAVIRKVQSIIGGSIHVRTQRPKKWRPVYHLRIYSNTLRWLLPQLSLIVKRRQSILVMRMLPLLAETYATSKGFVQPNRKMILFLSRKISLLNRRGTK
jgi:hypothetical protein